LRIIIGDGGDFSTLVFKFSVLAQIKIEDEPVTNGEENMMTKLDELPSVPGLEFSEEGELTIIQTNMCINCNFF